MSRRRPVGREAELAAVTSLRSGLVVLSGIAGSGRTTVLAQVDRRARESGRVVLRVAAGDDGGWDEYGVRAVLAAIRERFEDLDPGSDLRRALARVQRCAGPEGYGSPRARSALLHELTRLMEAIGHHDRLVILVDDADALGVPLPAPVVGAFAGHLVVAVVDERRTDPATRDLVAAADRVVTLAPLTRAEATALLRRRAGGAVAPALVDAVRDALGPLAGSPRALLGALDGLARGGRLADVHGDRCLRDPAAPVLLPADHPDVTAVDALGEAAREILVLAGAAPRIALDDLPVLAAATGRDANEHGRAVDALVGLGMIADTGSRLAACSPAVTGAVAAAMGGDRVRGLHAALVGALGAVTARGAGSAPEVFADHVAAAGAELAPDPALAPVLASAARRGDPRAAERRWAAAWWHAGTGAQRGHAARRWQELLLARGDYGSLAGSVARVVRADPPEGARRAGLAALAALAALHTGRLPDADVRAALTPQAGAADPLRFCAAWLAGSEAVPEDIEAALRALPDPVARASDAEPRTGWQRQFDLRGRHLAPVLSELFGSRYRPPSTGPAEAFARCARDCLDGYWTSALTAARQVLAEESGNDLDRRLVLLGGAEMLVWRGEHRLALRWLDALGEDPAPYATTHAWVVCGYLAATGDVDAALDHGCAVLERLGDVVAGRVTGGWLLLRLAIIAAWHGRDGARRRLLALCRGPAWAASTGISGTYAALARGLLTGDRVGVRAAATGIGAVGHRIERVWAGVAAGLADPAATEWWEEAAAIARDAGATDLGRRIAGATARAAGSRHPEDRAGGTEDRAGGTEDRAGGTEDRAGGTEGRAGGTEGRAGGPELTGPERELADLVRRGLTNRQIGRARRTSQKTVENQLTRLYAKTGCRTRYELATRMSTAASA